MTPGAGSEPWPGHAALVGRARAEGRFVAPGRVALYAEVARRRGHDWCTAVLARPYRGPGTVTLVEAEMLRLADIDDIDPPLPAAVLAERAAAAEHAAQTKVRRDAALAARRQAWADALEQCQVADLIRPAANASPRARSAAGGVLSAPLVHATASVDLIDSSGRLHRAGTALCERPTRARPRTLVPADAGTQVGPVTCQGCLRAVPSLQAPAAR